MLITPNAVKVFLCVQPADMRCSFSALSGLVRSQMGEDPLS
ncbi:MAG: IS66 family insertion sequence element accessory protein TnpB, partial [Cyanobacteria bacterium TGS_CYA1]|nr:IS66 family insertion sequence element accessory protein TnpB [Cyanobacteria bacterium TGS_CYA1]